MPPQPGPGPADPKDPAGPRAAGGRLPLLDVLRGAAILGTLMTNVWIFTGPGAEWGVMEGSSSGGSLHRLLDDRSPEAVAETLFRLVADGKFLALLTLLFGVGLAIQFESARKRGRPWPQSYRPRAWFLFAEGTVHFVLVFAWDVLMAYALTALLVARLLAASERRRRTALWTAAGFHLCLMAGLTAAFAATGPPLTAPTGPDTRIVDLYAHGSYPDQILFRIEHLPYLRLEPVLSFALLVVLFLVGVRLFRAGAFGADERARGLRRRLLRWGLGAGLPLTAAASLAGSDGFLLQRYVAAPVLALGYLGLIGALLDRVRTPGPLTAGLTAVGRTALSCYVAQNVLCVLACYGIGLGLAARYADAGPWWVMALWAAVSAVLVLASSLWLRHSPVGPLESLQKRLLRH
ncbi:DUF418 domain-containing protein [Kitasatospora sp. NPDC054939]